jgi:DNA-binding NtrC family response regulator
VELKLQVEELRARMQSSAAEVESGLIESRGSTSRERMIAGNGSSDANLRVSPQTPVGAIEPPGQPPGPRTITIAPGMTMVEIERVAIQAALAATKGNRRKAAEMLGIGERTMYRKLRDYEIAVP